MCCSLESAVVVQAWAATIGTVLSNNCQAFFTQLMGMVDKWQSEGMKEQGVWENSAYYVNSFATSKLICTIFQRIKAAFSPSDWNSLYGAFGKFIQAKKCGI